MVLKSFLLFLPLPAYEQCMLFLTVHASPEAFGGTVGIFGASAAKFGEGANRCCTEEGPKYSQNPLGQEEPWIRSGGITAFFGSEVVVPKRRMLQKVWDDC